MKRVAARAAWHVPYQLPWMSHGLAFPFQFLFNFLWIHERAVCLFSYEQFGEQMEASWVFVHHSDWIHWFSYVHKQTTKKYIYKCPYVNILQTRTRTLILSISLLSLSVSSLPVQETIQENQICPRSYWQTLWEAWVLSLTYRFSSKNALLHLLTREYNGHVGMGIPATENLLRQNLLISCRQASRSQSI